MEDPRYPVGRFDPHERVPHERRPALIDSIAAAPARLRSALAGLSELQLDVPYREGGWTARQVAHHVADSHLNACTRFRLALTEDNPEIRTYDQDGWAILADARLGPIEPSLSILDGLHARWVMLLRSLEATDYERTLRHPEMGQPTLGTMLRLYEWHGRHHVAHILALREREGWGAPALV